ncbi:hypothetical protein [Streptococcus acidominimus]|uniref:Uncharacterized protein n=1 Tax=Streptococcus acidominimus TaxID=1326 RepID=A0A1Q8EFT4_STRAI|nr:hypothetical protein [Streptococcus acidominimus]OLF50626.1 hypothetical protein BU200_00970 [Streptococcus acidominimus]SUN05229.1 Uncharacterised protein [Streptococcus acidominimus]
MPNITNDNVQIWTLYVTVAISLIGFLFNVISLWQTKKATEDMAKPYVNLYVEGIAVKSLNKVYVIKNFGQTPAYITSIKVISGRLDEFNDRRLFQSLIGNMIAPGQKLTSSIHPYHKESATVEIKYKDTHGKKYSDIFTLNPSMLKDFAYTVNESNKQNEIPATIRQSTMALLRDLL